MGVLNDSIPLLGSQNSTYSQTTWTHSIGKRNYEISNHLGNVLAVISDKVLLKDAGTYNTTTGVYISSTLDNKTDWFLADILQSNDYSAFGVQLNERSFKKGGFNRKTKRGFNGMEMDNEIHPGSDGLAEGDSYDFGARMYDPRLGRWLTIDPQVLDRISEHDIDELGESLSYFSLFCLIYSVIYKDFFMDGKKVSRKSRTIDKS